MVRSLHFELQPAASVVPRTVLSDLKVDVQLPREGCEPFVKVACVLQYLLCLGIFVIGR